MRLLVKVLAGIGIALVVLLAIVAVVIKTIDTQTLLTPIEAELERATGRDVTLGGRADISLSLTPTLKLADVTLGNAPWGSEKVMIRAKTVEAQVALLPLLSRRVDIVRFTLVEPSILLETDKQGRGNWAFGEPAKQPGRSDPVTDATGAFGLGEFEIEKGDVRWRDGRTGEVTAIRIERMYLRARDPGKPVVAEFSGSIDGVPLALEGHFGPLAALRAQQWPWPVSVKGEVAGRKTEGQAKVRATPDGIEASELSFGLGNAKARGTLTYDTRGPRPLIRFKLEADTLDAADLALAGGAATLGKGVKPPVSPKPDGRLFPATPIPLAALRGVDASGDIAIGKLVVNRQTLSGVSASIDLADGRLDVPAFRANLLGGSAQGRLGIDARNEKNPAIALRLDARGLDLAALMALAGVSREVKGGETDLDLDLNARGDSPRAWAASVSGIALAKVGRATWVSTNLGVAPEFSALLNTLNPVRATNPNTVLSCAVVRLPLANGVARVDRGIAFETDQLAGSASGTVDLRNESLDLAVVPRATVTGFDLSTLASGVRIRGPLAKPRVEVDPAGAIAAAAGIAALSRGGSRALIGSLFAQPSRPAPGGGECAVALAGARAEPPAQRTPPAQGRAPAPDASQELGRALGKLLGR